MSELTNLALKAKYFIEKNLLIPIVLTDKLYKNLPPRIQINVEKIEDSWDTLQYKVSLVTSNQTIMPYASFVNYKSTRQSLEDVLEPNDLPFDVLTCVETLQKDFNKSIYLVVESENFFTIL